MLKEFDEPVKITEEMKGGLALLYANKGLKNYLEHVIQIYNQAMIEAVDSKDNDKASACATRIKFVKRLLSLGRQNFINFEKIRKDKK